MDRILRPLENRSRLKRFLYTTSVLSFLLLLCFWKTDYTIWNTSGYLLVDGVRRLSIAIYRYLIGLTGCVTAYWLLGLIYTPFAASRLISEIGKTSLMNYIIHPFVISAFLNKIVQFVIAKAGYNILLSNIRLTEYFIAPILAFCLSAAIMCFVNLVKKIPIAGDYVFGFNICDAKKR
ncbi:MAG: hypothetical protein IJU41_01465 [Clostridia bacterium]|nr:hypothetical protein [Clostridia bacterium]